jgi:general secretion pathway protein J
MTRAGRGGFTLLEVLLALTIVAAVLTLAFGGLRVGIAAWRQGEDRIESLAHTRNLQVVIAGALAGAQAYLGVARQGEQASLQFRGGPGAVQFVTVNPPLPAGTGVAFTAVTIAGQGAGPGLVIRQKAMPNFEPFEEVEPSLTDSSIASVRFRYLRPEDGTWTDTWEVSSDPSASGIEASGRSTSEGSVSGSARSGSSPSGSAPSGGSTLGGSAPGGSTLGGSALGGTAAGRRGSAPGIGTLSSAAGRGSSGLGGGTLVDSVPGGSIPRAVEVTLTEITRGGQSVTHPPFTVSLRASTP